MTKLNAAIRNPRYAVVWMLFLILILAVYLSGLTIPLVGPDEPRYAQVAREMFERGDWVTPTLGGFNWFEKPALLYWLQIASYNLFGVSEFAARFGSALFGLGTVASLWILGRHVERQKSDAAASFADHLALVAASTVGIISFSHGASFDIILTFPITAALVSYYIFASGGRSRWLLSFYGFVGVALIAKGLVGIVFPFAIVAFYYLLSWKMPGRVLLISLFWGTALAAAIAATWYVPMYLRNGYEFVDQFIIQHHFQRYTSNKYLHPQPFYFFLWVLPLMTIPWLPFFIGALWNFVKRTVTPGAAGSAQPIDGDLLRFALAWLAVPLVFFSFSGSKLPGYILPAVPAAIILAAEFAHRFAQRSGWRKYVIEGISLATFAIILVGIELFVPRFAEAESVKGLFTKADEKGLGQTQVMMLHGLSHNAEFYAAGRIIRDAEGKPKRGFGPPEVARELERRGNEPVLVLVPMEYLRQLQSADYLNSEVVGDNGDWALAIVSLKPD